MKSELSLETSIAMPCGRLEPSCAATSLAACATASVFAPDCRMTPMPPPGTQLDLNVDSGFSGPSSPRDKSPKIGRASCRERVCTYVSLSVVAVSLQNKLE